jgi:hypothetical protein
MALLFSCLFGAFYTSQQNMDRKRKAHEADADEETPTTGRKTHSIIDSFDSSIFVFRSFALCVFAWNGSDACKRDPSLLLFPDNSSYLLAYWAAEDFKKLYLEYKGKYENAVKKTREPCPLATGGAIVEPEGLLLLQEAFGACVQRTQTVQHHANTHRHTDTERHTCIN